MGAEVIQLPQSVLGGCTAIVGASLLAMVSVRSCSWAALPASLASQLPQCVSRGCTAAVGGQVIQHPQSVLRGCTATVGGQVIQHPQSVLGGCTAIVGASLLAMVSVRSCSWAVMPVSPASARTSDWASAPSTSADGGRAGSRCRTGSPASPRPCVRCACAAVP